MAEKINWREKVLPEFLYPNKEWFIKRSLAVPDSIDGLQDNQLVIKLGGLRHLLEERGYLSVDTTLTHVESDHVSAKCVIIFRDDEHEDIHYSANASAHKNNTDDFGMRFLEAIAENRAFARCIRNFLNINVVSDEELPKGTAQSAPTPEQKVSSLSFKPVDVLTNLLAEKYDIHSLVKFKQTILRDLYSKGLYQNTAEEINGWKEFKHIGVKEIRKLIAILKEN